MIYVGGSVALHYPQYIFFTFFKYLLGIEESQVIMLNDIESVEMEDARFLKPAFGLGQWLAITHKKGKLLTGIWLSDSFKLKIIGVINDRRNQLKT
jgi:hypothetical protein